MPVKQLIFALRLMRRHKLQSAINLIGLALGLAACIIILGYVRYERSYDGWLPGSERIHQVQSSRQEAGQPASLSQNSPLPVREILPGLPGVAAATIVQPGKTVTPRNGEPLFIEVQTVDHDFFKVFPLKFIAGSADRALPNTNSIVLTRSEAIKQFGRADVLGETMGLGAGDGRRDYVVSGVVDDLPRNSSLRLSLMFLYDPAQLDGAPPRFRGWDAMGQQFFVRLQKGANAAQVEKALTARQQRLMPAPGGGGLAPSASIALDLVPLSAVHLGSATDGAMAPNGDPRALATFAVIALLILAMSIMNYVNLSTARALQRAPEVGLRKLFGASRRQLIVQFLGESLLTSCAATLLALAMAELAAPHVGALIGTPLAISYMGEGGMLLPAILLALFTGLAGGLYPAFVLSRFRPGRVLRASRSGSETPGSRKVRAALVVFQFTIAIALIASTWVIYSQTRFIETVDPGYRRDGLIQLESAWRFAGDQVEYSAARRELLAIPGVVAAGRTNLGVAATNSSPVAVRLPGAPAQIEMSHYGADNDYLATMDVPLLAGRLFDERFGRDRMPAADEGVDLAARGVNVVVSRTAIKRLGFATPGSAVGRTLALSLADGPPTPATIVGVVADMRLRTARDRAEPVIYLYDPVRTDVVLVRYADARPRDVMDAVHAVWRRYEPEIPFEGRFVEAIVADVYAADRARGFLFAGFSLVALLIASLGLYSLASFTTERRTKEIGIRKVLGARVMDIVRLLVWQFSRPVVLAGLLAAPIAWWAMRAWLNQFDIRIDLTPLPFVAAALLALAIALVTVISRAVRVARTNPIHALRYE